MKVLCVAEKPSIAKSIAGILSGGQFATRAGHNKFCKNYDFDYPQTNSIFTVTSVIGHLTTCDFDDAHRQWNSCDPFALFDAHIETSVYPDKKDIESNLRAEARRADTLMIWTDCDREGEHIGSEVAMVCRRAKPTINIKRARFSAIIAQQIHNAAQHPVRLDMSQAAAVEARILLDLKLGAAFTRMQTLALQQRFPELRTEGSSLVSYGPCQFPTLGFVVARHNQVKAFMPEDFWYIFLALSRPISSKGPKEETAFTWRRGHLFDEEFALALFDHVQESPRTRITKVTKKTTKKWKPLPLTTVELQKAGSRLLRLTPKKVLDLAEKLYQNGFLSYPRTETDQFDAQFDFQTLIQKQTVDPAWGAFATGLNNGGFNAPRRGKNNDKAHPPIHPTAHAGNLLGDEKRVYEFVTRRFLACCSKDAEGFETTVDAVCAGEAFYATGLIVLERNYLEVYVYDKWTGKEIPDFAEGEVFTPTKLELRTGQTTRPTYLTEADLVTLMDKNGIGTDATIAQHIQTIIDRGYVRARVGGGTTHLIPSPLGIGLVEGYDAIGLERSLSKPQLRRETERKMIQVCERTKTKEDMVEETITQYKDIFLTARTGFQTIQASVARRLHENVDDVDVDDHDNDDNGGDGGGGGGGAGGGRGGRGGGRGARGGQARGRGRGASRGADPPTRGRGGGRSRPPSARAPPPASDSDDDAPDHPAPPRQLMRSSRPAPPVARILCLCGSPAVEKTIVTHSTSKGKRYWGCGTDQACGFFQFIDGPSGPSGQSSAPVSQGAPNSRAYSEQAGIGPVRRCHCDVMAVEKTVVKDGSHKGRKFFTCGAESARCSFFEWSDQPPREMVSDGVGEGCFKCGKVGHWAKECPNDRGGSGTLNRPRGSIDNNSNRRIVCYKCDKEGHYINDCPNNDASSSKRPRSAPSNGSSVSTAVCYTCNEKGHFSNDCPNSGAGTSKRPRKFADNATNIPGVTCYKCNEEGHFSNECPNRDNPPGTSSRGSKKRGGKTTTRTKSKRGARKAAYDDY